MTLEIVRSRVEGFSAEKAAILSGMEADVICLRERERERIAPYIPGMHIGTNAECNVYGSTILACDKRLTKNSVMKDHGIMAELDQRSTFCYM